ncbi:MAG: fused MFS/spermidine synthase [Patescibacteria group bacterium]|nr:fused MFS/spermidine synthase [Patescibacteria group bacterium]
MIDLRKKIGPLEIMIFISGAVIMILELIGSRILAPYLGTSIFVWSSLIGVILGALSLGYYLGGRLSVAKADLKTLALILFIAGVSIAFIGIFKDTILYQSAKLGVKLGSVVATILLFSTTSVILGMVSPYAIKLKVKDLQNSGNVAGRLYALSTLGSIFGTFTAGFLLIPNFGSTNIVYGLSIILILTSLLGGINTFKILLLFLISSIWLNTFILPSKFKYETDSAYSHIKVEDVMTKDGQPARLLILATEVNSIIYLDSDKLLTDYVKYYRLDTLFNPGIKNSLTLGGGAYTSPQDYQRRFPDNNMDVVEIDPKVTQTARTYFGLKDNPKLNIIHEDGRIFLNNNTKKYDSIYGDAFSSYYSIPFQLTTSEAIKKIYDSLNEDGLYALNFIGAISGSKSIFFQAEIKTLAKFFPQLYIFPNIDQNLNSTLVQNIVIFASKKTTRIAKGELVATATPELKSLANNLTAININTNSITLSDNYAPVDNYVASYLSN